VKLPDSTALLLHRPDSQASLYQSGGGVVNCHWHLIYVADSSETGGLGKPTCIDHAVVAGLRFRVTMPSATDCCTLDVSCGSPSCCTGLAVNPTYINTGGGGGAGVDDSSQSDIADRIENDVVHPRTLHRPGGQSDVHQHGRGWRRWC